MIKGLIYTALAVTGFTCVVAVSTAQAQLAERLRFTTSFPFTVGTTRFAPGDYTVQPADDNNMEVLRISNGHTAAFIVVIPEGIPRDKPRDNELTFVRVGDHYMLEQIWDASDQSAMEPTLTARRLAQAVLDGDAEAALVLADLVLETYLAKGNGRPVLTLLGKAGLSRRARQACWSLGLAPHSRTPTRALGCGRTSQRDAVEQIG